VPDRPQNAEDEGRHHRSARRLEPGQRIAAPADLPRRAARRTIATMRCAFAGGRTTGRHRPFTSDRNREPADTMAPGRHSADEIPDRVERAMRRAAAAVRGSRPARRARKTIAAIIGPNPPSAARTPYTSRSRPRAGRTFRAPR